MKVILDECLPRRLARHLGSHDVSTVPSAGLAGLKNGKLLEAISDRFDAFVTIDGNIEYQQRLSDRPFFIVVLRGPSNRLEDLLPLAPRIVAALGSGQPGQVYHLE